LKAYAVVASGVILVEPMISPIVLLRANSQVGSAIIESVAIDVIYEFSSRHQHSMHQNFAPSAAGSGVKNMRSLATDDTPRQLRQSFVVRRVAQSDKSSSH
jgi:hypothetical protein